jgi:hypothetical protein
MSAATPQTAIAPPVKKDKTPPKQYPTSIFVKNIGGYELVEPYTNQRFAPGLLVEIPGLTAWLKSCVTHKLLDIIES